MANPIFFTLIAIMTGIIGSNFFSIPNLPIRACLIVTLFLIFFSFTKKWKKLFNVSLFLSFLLLGILEMNIYLYHPPGERHIRHFLGVEKITAEGMICENPQKSDEKTALVVCVSRMVVDGQYQSVSGRVLLNIREPYRFCYGDQIRFRSKLRIPRNFKNPGHFDYEKYLRLQRILVQGSINDATDFIVLRRGTGNPLRTSLELFRDRIRTTILEKAPGVEGKIIQAMILGDQKEIPKEVLEIFNRTGTTHIIAISGFNIGIVAFFSFFVFRLFFKPSEYLLLRWNMATFSILFSILVVILYTFIAGSGFSVVRASIMVVIFMIAILLNRERDLYNTLTMAAFLILIIAPYSLFDVSFQLSFTAVASLLFLMPRLMAFLPAPPQADSLSLNDKNKLNNYLNMSVRTIIIFCFVSLSATLGTLPLILFYFNRLSIITLAANLIAVPILGIIATPICLVIIIAMPISAFLAEFVIWIAEFLVRISLSLLEKLASLPWASVFVSTPTFMEMATFYLLLISCGLCLDYFLKRVESRPSHKKAMFWKLSTLFLVILISANAIHTHLQGLWRGKLTLTFIDVGQGNATLIRFPGGKRMLVDGGGYFENTFDIGKYVLAPFLWSEKISRIDTVVLTHPHSDHLQGLLFILENFHVTEVWTNGMGIDSPLYHSFCSIILKKGIALRVMADTEPEMEIAGVRIRVLNPPIGSPHDTELSSRVSDFPNLESLSPRPPSIGNRLGPFIDINEHSLAMKLTFGSQRLLLLGDISEKTESRLIHSNADLRSELLLVPHHGGFRSCTNAFLEKVRPETAVISCGTDNVFRNPHPDIIKKLADMNTNVFRTDRDGAITIETDGTTLITGAFIRGRP